MHTVFLAGAGISVSPPSSLPTAGQFITSILNHIIREPKARERLIELATGDRNSPDTGNEFIRMETILEVVQEWIDPELDLLRAFAIPTDPNAMHTFLATRMRQGDTVLTTNFDPLIELAVVRCGGRPLTATSGPEFAIRAQWPDTVPVYKLHGSVLRLSPDSQEAQATIESVQATVERITRASQGMELAPEIAEPIANWAKGARLIVLGYSGSDDFDVMPFLGTLDLAEMIWIDHRSVDLVTEVTPSSASPTADEWQLSPRDRLLARLARAGVNTRLLSGPTPEAIARIFGAIPLPTATSGSGPEPDLAELVSDWSANHGDDWAHDAVATDLLLRGSRFEAALAIAQSLVSRDGGRSDDAAARARMMLSKCHVGVGNYEGARDALKDFHGEVDVKMELRIHHQLGVVESWLGNSNAARDHLCRALAMAQQAEASHWIAYALNDLGLLDQADGHHDRACDRFSQSASISTANGDVQHQSWARLNGAASLYELARFEDAQDELTAAARVAHGLGDVRHLVRCWIELGLVLCQRGKPSEAVETLTRARDSLSSHRADPDWVIIGLNIFLALWEARDLCAAKHALVSVRPATENAQDPSLLVELLVGESLLSAEFGNLTEAHSRARRATELAIGLGPYEEHSARFIEVAVGVKRGLRAGSELDEALAATAASKLAVLAMDQHYRTCRLGLTPELSASTRATILDTQKRYQEIGNSIRSEVMSNSLNTVN